MLNPFGSNNTESYFDFRSRLLRKMKSSKLDKQIIEMIQSAYETALKSENIVLSKVEHERLIMNLSTQILDDIAKQIKSNP